MRKITKLLAIVTCLLVANSVLAQEPIKADSAFFELLTKEFESSKEDAQGDMTFLYVGSIRVTPARVVYPDTLEVDVNLNTEFSKEEKAILPYLGQFLTIRLVEGLTIMERVTEMKAKLIFYDKNDEKVTTTIFPETVYGKDLSEDLSMKEKVIFELALRRVVESGERKY